MTKTAYNDEAQANDTRSNTSVAHLPPTRGAWSLILDAQITDIPHRTSRTPSHGSTAVSPTPRSASTISAASAPPSTTSQHACTSSPTNTSSSRLRLSKLPASAPTSTWSRSPARKVSTYASARTRSTSSASTRCCRALVPIDCRRVCVVLLASRTVWLRV